MAFLSQVYAKWLDFKDGLLSEDEDFKCHQRRVFALCGEEAEREGGAGVVAPRRSAFLPECWFSFLSRHVVLDVVPPLEVMLNTTQKAPLETHSIAPLFSPAVPISPSVAHRPSCMCSSHNHLVVFDFDSTLIDGSLHNATTARLLARYRRLVESVWRLEEIRLLCIEKAHLFIKGAAKGCRNGDIPVDESHRRLNRLLAYDILPTQDRMFSSLFEASRELSAWVFDGISTNSVSSTTTRSKDASIGDHARTPRDFTFSPGVPDADDGMQKSQTTPRASFIFQLLSALSSQGHFVSIATFAHASVDERSSPWFHTDADDACRAGGTLPPDSQTPFQPSTRRQRREQQETNNVPCTNSLLIDSETTGLRSSAKSYYSYLSDQVRCRKNKREGVEGISSDCSTRETVVGDGITNKGHSLPPLTDFLKKVEEHLSVISSSLSSNEAFPSISSHDGTSHAARTRITGGPGLPHAMCVGTFPSERFAVHDVLDIWDALTIAEQSKTSTQEIVPSEETPATVRRQDGRGCSVRRLPFLLNDSPFCSSIRLLPIVRQFLNCGDSVMAWERLHDGWWGGRGGRLEEEASGNAAANHVFLSDHDISTRGKNAHIEALIRNVENMSSGTRSLSDLGDFSSSKLPPHRVVLLDDDYDNVAAAVGMGYNGFHCPSRSIHVEKGLAGAERDSVKRGGAVTPSRSSQSQGGGFTREWYRGQRRLQSLLNVFEGSDV